MILLRAAGCTWEPDEAVQARLARAADAFVRAGGAVTLTEWALLTGAERAALEAAHARFWCVVPPEDDAIPPEDDEARERRLLLEAVDREVARLDAEATAFDGEGCA